MDYLEALRGTVTIGKAEGVMPGELVRWIQEVLETTTLRWPSPVGDKRRFPEEEVDR
jgi:hypothetical protein